MALLGRNLVALAILLASNSQEAFGLRKDITMADFEAADREEADSAQEETSQDLAAAEQTHLQEGGGKGDVEVGDTSREAFVCPEECIECCQSGKMFSGSYFKCVLKDAANALQISEASDSKRQQKLMIKGRACSGLTKDAGKRLWKVYCNYNKDEEKAPAKCSDRFGCCCDQDNGWTETKCINSEEDQLQQVSNHSGEMETYEKTGPGDSEYNNMEACKRETDPVTGEAAVHHPYQKPPPANGDPSGKRVPNVNTGCCLETKRQNVNHKWTKTGMQMGNPPRMKIDHKNENVMYTVCKRHEKLYRCSLDEGVSYNEGHNVYSRIQTQKTGVCIGEEQPDPVKGLKLTGGPYHYQCPSGTFTGNWCACENACGYTIRSTQSV